MKFSWRVNTVIVSACILLSAVTLRAAEPMSLWPDGSTELAGVDEQHIPTLHLYPGPETDAKKPAVLICPAGGYKHHSDSRRQAEWLNSLGIAAYVVKYRLPVHGYKHPAPLHDAQRAMRIIRHNAEAWGLDGAKLGVLGGSSGGHVATTLATHYDDGDETSNDAIERQGCRPDFVMLSDAVITMQGKACHFYSRGRLLPADPSQELIDHLSNELQVTLETPPTFLVAGGQDKLVPADNSLMYFLALRKQRVPFCELHFYSHGGHGFKTPPWFDAAEEWLRRLDVLPPHDGEKPWPGQFDKAAWEAGDYLPQ